MKKLTGKRHVTLMHLENALASAHSVTTDKPRSATRWRSTKAHLKSK